MLRRMLQDRHTIIYLDAQYCGVLLADLLDWSKVYAAEINHARLSAHRRNYRRLPKHYDRPGVRVRYA